METKLKYYKQLSKLLSRPQFSIREAFDVGVPRHALIYYCEIGILERVFRGIYRSKAFESKVDISWESLVITTSAIPHSVICLISALAYYDLTDEIPRENWIAIPHSKRSPKKQGARIVRMRNIDLGRIEIKIGEYNVNIFDREKCIVDAFRYLSIEIAIKALKAYFEDHTNKISIQKLSKYAKKLRVNIKPYILSITT